MKRTRAKPPLAGKFWKKVNRDGPTPPHCPEIGSCWIWTGNHDTRGYGTLVVDYKRVKAHRTSWFLTCGYWSKLFICHKCDNPPCVRPEHLFEGTPADNMADGKRKGRVHVIKNCIGQRYGHLTATAFDRLTSHAWFRCVCDCGRETVSRGTDLRRLHAKCCGKKGCPYSTKRRRDKTTIEFAPKTGGHLDTELTC